MVRVVALVALAGCGRVGFEVATDSNRDTGPADSAADVVPLGHDEDGDGIPDESDPCPHIINTVDDADSDGVGDDCDPNPGTPGDAIAVFATMVPGDTAFTVLAGDGEWVPEQDSLRFTGDFPTGGDNNLFGTARFPIDAAGMGVYLAIGVDITVVLTGSDSGQNQLAISAWDAALPKYFGEINQVPAQFDNAQIVRFDGTNYLQMNSSNLQTGIHTGSALLELTERVGTSVRFDFAYPGEPYTAGVSDGLYQGTTSIELNTNNLHFEIRWLVLITSP